jgi:hypothetical protein
MRMSKPSWLVEAFKTINAVWCWNNLPGWLGGLTWLGRAMLGLALP